MFEIGHHSTVKLWDIAFNLDTIISMSIVSAFIIICAIIIRFTILSRRSALSLPRVALEMLYEGLEGIPVGIMGRQGLAYVGLIATLFIFILLSNLFGLIPVNAFYSFLFERMFGPIPELPAPTADINITGGLALLVFLALHYIGIRSRGFKYFKKFFEPNFVFFPINLMEELAKPFSLAIRLFGNTFGKETILVVLISLTVFPLLYPVPIMALGLMIAVIQAFIFALLTTFYIAAAISEGH